MQRIGSVPSKFHVLVSRNIEFFLYYNWKEIWERTQVMHYRKFAGGRPSAAIGEESIYFPGEKVEKVGKCTFRDSIA